MNKMIAYGETFEVNSAVKDGDTITGYVGNHPVITSGGISDFSGYRYEDTNGNEIPWDAPQTTPTPADQLAALEAELVTTQLALAELAEVMLNG